MDANPGDGSFFIVRIRARFANAVYQKVLIVARLVMSTCVKPYQDSLNWRLRQVRRWINFGIRKYGC